MKSLILIGIFLVAASFPAATLQCSRNISPVIVNDLVDLVGLVPTVVIDELVAKHYIIDGGFRTALKYVRSGAFMQLVDRAQQTAEVCDILVYLHMVNATGVMVYEGRENRVPVSEEFDETNGNDLEVVLLEEFWQFAHQNSLGRYKYSSVGTFTGFVRELLDHLPRSQFKQAITAKRQQSAEFNEFYKALRSAQLKTMVDATMKSNDLAFAVKSLRANAIDPVEMRNIAFEVISWGPSV